MELETTSQRSNIMKAIKSKNTSIEVLFRKTLWHLGIRYRKNMKLCSCHPDIIITKYKIAIFCDGDFWHGRELKNRRIKHNEEYWTEKIRRNIERDLENTIQLRDNGWIVLRFWESDIKSNLDMCIDIVRYNIKLRKNDKSSF